VIHVTNVAYSETSKYLKDNRATIRLNGNNSAHKRKSDPEFKPHTLKYEAECPDTRLGKSLCPCNACRMVRDKLVSDEAAKVLRKKEREALVAKKKKNANKKKEREARKKEKCPEKSPGKKGGPETSASKHHYRYERLI